MPEQLPEEPESLLFVLSPEAEPLPAAIIVSGEALQGLSPEEQTKLASDIQAMVRARLGSSAVQAVAADVLMPVDHEQTLDEFKAAVGGSVRALRGATNQRTFAQDTGTAQSAVSVMEAGIYMPKVVTLQRLARTKGRRLGVYMAAPPPAEPAAT